MKINEFFKNNKIAVIAGSAVLAVAIISGIAFGVVNHKNKVNSKSFTPNGSSVSTGSDRDIPPIEGSSESNTSGEAATGSEATNSDNSSAENSSNSTIEVIPTPNKNNSSAASSTSSKKPAASTNTPSSSVASTQPAASTPSTPATPTTPSTDKWTCPDPSAHPETDVSQCVNEYMHKQHVNVHQTKLEEEAKPNKRNPEDVGVKCWICNKPFGDGHNGTCYNYFENGKYTCHHYD